MKSLRKQLGKESVSGVLFTLPFIIGFILFMIVPMGISLYYSFCDYDILSPPVFSGLNNFKEMLKDDILIQSIKVTFYFAFVSTEVAVCTYCRPVASEKFQNVRFLPRSVLSSFDYRRLCSSVDPVEENVCYGWRY